MPDQAQVRFNLGLALYKSARIAEAAAEFEQVVAQDPKNKSAVLLLADCRLQTRQDAGAVVDLLGPREEELKGDRLFVYLMGNALVRSNDLSARAGVHRPPLARGRSRGGAPADGRRPPAAGTTAARRSPSSRRRPRRTRPCPRSTRCSGGRSWASAAATTRSPPSARSSTRNPNDFDSNLYLGLFLKDDGKLDEAEEHLKRAGRLRPNDPAVLYMLGSLHLAAGRAEEAQQGARDRDDARCPTYRQAHVLLATAYYRLKDKEEGDRHRDIAEKLRAEEQAREPGPVDELAPAPAGARALAAAGGWAGRRRP